MPKQTDKVDLLWGHVAGYFIGRRQLGANNEIAYSDLIAYLETMLPGRSELVANFLVECARRLYWERGIDDSYVCLTDEGVSVAERVRTHEIAADPDQLRAIADQIQESPADPETLKNSN